MKVAIALIVSVLLTVGTLQADEVDIKVGILHFPPFYVVSEDRAVSGVYAELLRKILERAGYSYTIDGFPPKRFYTQLGDNTTNLFIGVKGSKYIEGKVAFGKLKFEGIELRAYSMKGRPIITDKNELIGKRVIVIRAFGYGGLAKFLSQPENNIQLIEATDHFSAFKMLVANRGDYLLDYRTTSQVVIDELNLQNIEHGVLLHAYTYFIINKQYPDYEKVLHKLEATYMELMEEGVVDNLLAKE